MKFKLNLTKESMKGFLEKLKEKSIDVLYWLAMILFGNPIAWFVYVCAFALMIAMHCTNYQRYTTSSDIEVIDRVHSNKGSCSYILGKDNMGKEKMFKLDNLFQRPDDTTDEKLNYLFLKCQPRSKLRFVYCVKGNDNYLVRVENIDKEKMP